MNCSHAGLRTVYGFFARGSFYEIGATRKRKRATISLEVVYKLFMNRYQLNLLGILCERKQE